LCRCNVQRRSPCGNHSGPIAKTIPGSRVNRSPSRRNHCSPSARNPVRLHPGTLFTITPESRSPSPGRPRTDPYVQNCCIRLLSRMHGVEAHVRVRMHDPGTGDPSNHKRSEPRPGHPASLAPPPKRTVPAPDYLATKAFSDDPGCRGLHDS